MLKQKINLTKYLTAINIALFVLIIAVDQFYKYKIRQLGGFYVCNDGISFNLKIPHLFFWLTVALFIALILFLNLYRKKIKYKPLILTGISIILSGASSNLIDRYAHGCIIDHLYITNGFSLLFNLADITISTGGLLLFIQLLSPMKVKK